MAGKARYWSAWATAWGPMAAAATDAGLCCVLLPHYQLDDLKQLMQWEHRKASEDAAPFADFRRQSEAYFKGERVDFADIALDLPAAGSFSGLALRACREIPYGRTRSYSELAREIGRPDAARAVATAMSRNALPLVVPCHRVTRANGALGGFSAPAGVELKKRMLDLERRVAGD